MLYFNHFSLLSSGITIKNLLDFLFLLGLAFSFFYSISSSFLHLPVLPVLSGLRVLPVLVLLRLFFFTWLSFSFLVLLVLLFLPLLSNGNLTVFRFLVFHVLANSF